VARRNDWVELREPKTEGVKQRQEWAVTESGRLVRPPESLHLPQVVLRVLRVADPVRKGAADWLPLAALLLGGVAAAGEKADTINETTANVARIIAICVLVYAVARGGVGERDLVKAARAFPRLQQDGYYEPLRRFHSWPRLAWVAVFDIAVLSAFGMAFFLVWPWVLVPIPVAVLIFVLVERKWRRPAREVARTRPSEGQSGNRST